MACTFEIIKYNIILRNRKFANIHFCTRKFDLTSLILKDPFHDRRKWYCRVKIEYVLSISNNNNRDSRANKFARSYVVEKKNNSKIPFSNNYFYFWLVPYSYFRDTSEKSKVYKVECREREREKEKASFIWTGQPYCLLIKRIG